jgi:WXG100 family type VII secretion target
MSPAKIQADYDQLDAIARQFTDQADAIAELTRELGRIVDSLRNGGWVGMGANYFYDEMGHEVFPAMHRLSDALYSAGDTTRQISRRVRDAEEEASRPFIGG